jgi:hypothetical protein
VPLGTELAMDGLEPTGDRVVSTTCPRAAGVTQMRLIGKVTQISHWFAIPISRRLHIHLLLMGLILYSACLRCLDEAFSSCSLRKTPVDSA